MLCQRAEQAFAAAQAQKAGATGQVVMGRATLRAWYLAEPPPPGVVTLAAAFPAQTDLAHFEEAFHGFLGEHQGDLPATASTCGYVTDDGQVRECLPESPAVLP